MTIQSEECIVCSLFGLSAASYRLLVWELASLLPQKKNALVVARMTVMKKLDVFDASYTCLLIAMRTGVTHCLTLPALTLLRRLEVQ